MRRRILAGAAAVVVVLIIAIVALTQGSSGEAGAYRSYLAALGPIAVDSQQVGESLAGSFGGSRGKGVKRALVTELDGLLQRAVSDVTRLQLLAAPAELRAEQEQAIAALDLRVQGLQGIRTTLAEAAQSQNADASALKGALSTQVADLVTSDLIWDSAVRGPTLVALQNRRVHGLAVPASRFIADNKPSLLASMLNLLSPVAAAGVQPLALGASGAAVVSLQTQLNEWVRLSAPTQTPLTPDGSFGPATQAATKALQTAEGIPPTGILDTATQRALTRVLSAATPPSAGGSTTQTNLTLGDTGPAVRTWQTQLNQWLKATASSQTPLTPDGSFGPATEAATKALQTAQGISPSGIVDASTRRALESGLAAHSARTNSR
jgi:peptidoglycan hydrolase-like protein with peptidoglycan-binding domain